MDQVRVRVPLLREAVTGRLVDAIVRGELQPGERLTEVELADRLGVSRSPMREALHRLVDDGLVVREPRRGVSVARIDPTEASDFYDCRILLESRCAVLATPFVTADDLRGLGDLHARMVATADQGHLFEYLAHVETFHDLYRRACPNQELVEIIHKLSARALRLRALNIVRPGRTKFSLSQHKRILQALRRGDADLVATRLTELLETSKAGILQSLAEHPELGTGRPTRERSER